MNDKMENAYQADDLMHEVVRIFTDAQKVIQDRVACEREGKLTEETLDKFKQDFTSMVARTGSKVNLIEGLINSVRKSAQIR
jgi:hypothetical protein